MLPADRAPSPAAKHGKRYGQGESANEMLAIACKLDAKVKTLKPGRGFASCALKS
jgi:hypothetical protein